MVGRVRKAGRVGQGNRAVQGVRVGEVRTYASKRSFHIAHQGAYVAVNGNRHIVQIQILPCRPVLKIRAVQLRCHISGICSPQATNVVPAPAQQQALSSAGTRRAERRNES